MPEVFFYTILGLTTLACCAKLGYEWLRLSTTRRTEKRLKRYVRDLRR